MQQFGPVTDDAVVRPGAYGVVSRHDGSVAVVRVRNALYLPGGGIEAGETPEHSLHREVAEEAGLLVAVEEVLGTVMQAIPRGARPTLNKQCHYFRCAVTGHTVATEDDHELVWVPPQEAVDALWLEADRWAVRRAYPVADR